jgi:hypothetical protein
MFKSEIRISNLETISNVLNSNDKNSFGHLKIRISDLFRASGFDIRNLSLCCPRLSSPSANECHCEERSDARLPARQEAIFESKMASRRTLAMILKKRSGQATLEMTAALVIVMILLAAAARIFAWVNGTMSTRQADYESHSVEAGSASASVDLGDQGSTTGIETNVPIEDLHIVN